MDLAAQVIAAINDSLEDKQDSGFRNHLGASVLGRECARQVYYIFRWADEVRHGGRMLRLFDRGHRAELKFATWLMNAGIHVQLADPDTGKQFRVVALEGHIGGSLDAKLSHLPGLPTDVVFLGEFKTHNDKSFKSLQRSGVAGSKWEHYIQMQIYMHLEGVGRTLYIAINKNDDDLYMEIVDYNERVAVEYLNRGARIVHAEGPPPRINDSPGWWQCKFCDYRDVCHFEKPYAINCRTCSQSRPIEDGKWICRMYDYVLSREEQQRGCTNHTPVKG
jgi:hypothetical protein